MNAIVIHFYYLDMLNELSDRLTRLRNYIDFDVIVTIPDMLKSNKKDISNKLQANQIIAVENKGRDVLPFLKIIHLLEPYDHCCKIHTKTIKPGTNRGPTPKLSTWRDDMWESLLCPEQAKRAMYELKYNSDIFAPKNLWIFVSGENDYKFVRNFQNMKKIEKVTGIKIKPIPFIAGTMFWFNPKALLHLKDYNFDLLFEPECGAGDGKLEHAFERSFHQLLK